MDDLELKLASLKYLCRRTKMYQNIILNKNYKDLQTKKYRRTFESVCNSIKGEKDMVKNLIQSAGINNIRESFTVYEIKEHLRNNSEFESIQNKLDEISIKIFNKSELIEANIINEFDFSPEWVFPTSTANYHEDITIVESHNANNPSNNLDSLFVNALMSNQRVEETLASWLAQSKIAHRHIILKEGVECHLDEKFYASTSTLIPLVEGFLRDVLGEDYEFNSMRKDDMKKATNALKNIWKSKSYNVPETTLLLDCLPNVVADLYEEYIDSKSIPGKLYRHGICHGNQTDFGSKKNSLRLILILDRIIFFYAMN